MRDARRLGGQGYPECSFGVFRAIGLGTGHRLLPGTEALGPWMGRLQQLGVVRQGGRTAGVRYFVEPKLLRELDFTATTTLRRIEPHRLRALILEELQRYPGSALGDIHRRIGEEIDKRRIKRALDGLVREERVRYSGEKRGRRYWVVG